MLYSNFASHASFLLVPPYSRQTGKMWWMSAPPGYLSGTLQGKTSIDPYGKTV